MSNIKTAPACVLIDNVLVDLEKGSPYFIQLGSQTKMVKINTVGNTHVVWMSAWQGEKVIIQQPRHVKIELAGVLANAKVVKTYI